MKGILALMLSFSALSFAAPTTKRETFDGTADVTLCTDSNKAGTCQTWSLPFDGEPDMPFTKCVQLEAPLYNNVGTFLVAPGAYCRTTSVDNCANLGSGDAILFPPGSEDFKNYSGGHAGDANLGGRTASFQCQKCTNCT
ncbi:hypothetical protein EJ05DRAFT_474306 [Pseudovirgaria hyperparasitica]|uniref:Uncharacterized protein n=1 Tax=Pseudovirgaria hyperparasitica TaxID=470096 RepID=A0A6A6WEH3_9PEZI|nr:uncharacterized protein EJ05DRAFT_474306 [Pseudovirgaria hyperparasitica]KAF2760434.1 hypothetical protein EJ05DRAFT_474306 [Pseudovirgaria hyperparasitica]